MTDVRGGVYPFCRSCTTSSAAWRVPDPTRMRGLGTHFYGHRDVCPNCSSSVRTLFVTFLGIPISRVGQYRIIRTGGRSYVGRRLYVRGSTGTPGGGQLRRGSALGRVFAGRKTMFAGQLVPAIQLLETTLADSIDSLRANHPGHQSVARSALKEACELPDSAQQERPRSARRRSLWQ